MQFSGMYSVDAIQWFMKFSGSCSSVVHVNGEMAFSVCVLLIQKLSLARIYAYLLFSLAWTVTCIGPIHCTCLLHEYNVAKVPHYIVTCYTHKTNILSSGKCFSPF